MDSRQAINKIGGEHWVDDLVDALLRVSEEVKASGKDGKVTTALTIKRAGPDQVIIMEQITTSLPKADPQGASFFLVDGEFHENNPNQGKLDIHVVNVEEGTGVILDPPEDTNDAQEGD